MLESNPQQCCSQMLRIRLWITTTQKLYTEFFQRFIWTAYEMGILRNSPHPDTVSLWITAAAGQPPGTDVIGHSVAEPGMCRRYWPLVR